MQVEDGLNPRCFARVKLTPPAPLPHVSRRALKRVNHWIKPPTECDCCGTSGVRLVGNEEVYGKPYGLWPYCYVCPHCRAYVGLHPETDLPLGFMADSFIRDARKAAKAPFQCICRVKYESIQDCYDVKRERMVKRKIINRSAAYEWLSKATGIEPKLCHFAMMDEDTAMRVFEVCFNYLFEEC